MLTPNDDSKIDWQKMLDSLEEKKIPTEMTKEEFNIMFAAKFARASLATEDFNADNAWDDFVKRRNRPRLIKMWLLRSAAAAIVILAIGTVVWINNKKNNTPQIADAKPSGKVRLKTGDGRIVELGSGQQKILYKNASARISSEGNSLTYTQDGKGDLVVKLDTLEVPRGFSFRLQLPDGSNVWLNAGSKLMYPAAFNGATRQVYLEGEAYFDIVPRINQPFLVNARGMELNVLGTAFNVNTFNRFLATTLCSGSLLVKTGSQKIVLQPNEQSLYNSLDGSLHKRLVDTRDFTAWKDGELYFDNVALLEITGYLSRNYDYNFEITDPSMKGLRFTLDMPRPERLQTVLDHLHMIRTDISFRVVGKTVQVIKVN